MSISYKRTFMDAANSLAGLYDVMNKELGQVAAREALSDAIYLVINDLQEASLPITPENIQAGLEKYATDFIEVAKANAA
jgi:hypothetical protein